LKYSETCVKKTVQSSKKDSPKPVTKNRSRNGPQLAGAQMLYVGSLASAANASSVVQAQEKFARQLQQGETAAEPATAIPAAVAPQPEAPSVPLQFMKFTGLLSGWSLFRSSEEDALLAQEEGLKEFLSSMEPYEHTSYGNAIKAIKRQVVQIENSTVEERDYARTRDTLNRLRHQLDGISTSIARLGLDYEREHEEIAAALVEEGHEGSRANQLKYLITETFSLLPGPLQTEDNRTVVQQAIYPPLAYGRIQNRDLTPQSLDFARTRVRVLRRNFKRMLDRINGDWEAICGHFGIDGRLRFLHLTGSDFHNDGQSVSIIETTTGERVVYKPRDLTPDRELTGTGTGALGAFVGGAGTSRFLGKTDANRGGEHYGYMEYQRKLTTLSVAEARNYYFKMGQMTVATKLLGVTDLHQDNILTGRDGNPLIIDAETSFLPDVMMSEAWNGTLIGDALKTFQIERKLTVNYFLTDTEREEWEEVQRRDEGETLGGFVTEKRKESVKSGGAFHRDFTDGVRRVLEFVTDRKAQVIEYVQKRARAATNVRIVPLRTTEFTGAMTAYNSTPSMAQQVLTVTCSQIRQSLEGKGYVLAGSFDLNVKAGLAEDFARSDIPLFHYEPQDDRIYYKGRAVAIHHPGIQVAIATNVDRITHATVDEVVTGLGLD
jgi:Domain of unknown function (DUF4135)